MTLVLDQPGAATTMFCALERQPPDARRAAPGAAYPALGFVARQQGLFALLPIPPDAAASLRQDHGIYMPQSGRINIAGLRDETILPFVTALAPYLKG